MIPTRQGCITQAQFLLGDPNGADFTTATVGTAADSAYREWTTQCDINQIPDAKFTAYYFLPAFQAQFTPAQASLANFGELVTLEEMDIAATLGISTCDTATPINVATVNPVASAGIGQNTEIMIFGVTGQTSSNIVGENGANGRWLANVTGASTIQLPGSVSVAAYVSGGTIVVPSLGDSWTIIIGASELPERLPQNRLGIYTWENDTFYFVGSNKDRLVKIIYYGSGTAPANGSLGYDNIQDYIAYRATAILAGTRDMQRAASAEAKASEFLNMLLDEHVRALQRQPVRPKAYKAGGYSNVFNTWPFQKTS